MTRTNEILVAVFALSVFGCIPSKPTRTTRPQIDSSPWQQRSVRSPRTGAEYEYLYLPGPSEDAEALVLLHGGIFDARIWLNTAGFAERFAVYALEWPDNSLYYTGHVENFGDIAHDFVESLGLSGFHLAGVSMGSYAAIDLASRYGKLDVRSLLLFSAVMFAISEEEIDGRTKMAKRALGFSPSRLQGIVEWRVFGTDFPPSPGRITQHDIFYVRPYPYYFQVFSMAYNQAGRAQDTGAIRCPVLIASGERDDTMPVGVVALSSEVFSNALAVEFVSIPDEPHSMVFSYGPELVDLVFGFLDRYRATSPAP